MTATDAPTRPDGDDMLIANRPTVTDRVRLAVTARMGACPTCFAPRDISIRTVAKLTGVSPNTVSRFLRGEVIESDSLDRLDAWARP